MPDSRFWGLGCVRECLLSAKSGHSTCGNGRPGYRPPPHTLDPGLVTLAEGCPASRRSFSVERFSELERGQAHHNDEKGYQRPDIGD